MTRFGKLFSFATVLCFTIVYSLVSCNYANGQGELQTKEFPADEFTKIHISVPGEVLLTRADTHSLEIEAGENYLEHIEVKIKNGVLHIDFAKRIRKAENIKMNISLPTLEGITIDGANTVKGEGTFTSELMEIDVNGAGTIKLAVETPYTNIEINGSGNLELTGSTDLLKVEINGAGDLDAFGFKAKSASVEVNGAGNCNLFTSHTLNAEINGVGSIKYKGNPVTTNFERNGIGSVSAVD